MASILIIDDEKFARVTLRKILERAGHRIEEAANGLEGVKMFRNGKFDLVITDIIMPEMEGLEVIVELKRIAPDVRIIASSGGGRSGNLDFLKLAAERGAQHVLPKPFTQTDLLELVAVALR